MTFDAMTFDAGEFVGCLKAVRPPIESASSLPPAAYSRPEILDLERRLIFHRGWVGLGRADRWRQSGDYMAFDLAGVPVVVLRDRGGRLRAYANSCRHRGAKIVEGAGHCKILTCPFHGWAYGLDGKLRSAPHMPGDDCFKKDDFGLHAFHIEERAGFAFLSLEAAPPDIDAWLGDFVAVHQPWHFEELVTTQRREIEVPCNWKPFLEVFNEYYHLQYVHPRSIASIYGAPDAPETVTGEFVTQFGETEGTGGLTEDNQAAALPINPRLTGREAKGVRYSWVFPNMTFAAGADALWVIDATPVSATATRVGLSICFPPATLELESFEARAAVYYERFEIALGEDIEILTRQQAGLSSPFAQQGRFAPDLEPNVANFAFWYASIMRQGNGCAK